MMDWVVIVFFILVALIPALIFAIGSYPDEPPSEPFAKRLVKTLLGAAAAILLVNFVFHGVDFESWSDRGSIAPSMIGVLLALGMEWIIFKRLRAAK